MEAHHTRNARRAFAVFALSTLFDAIDAGHETKIASPRIQEEFENAPKGGAITMHAPQFGRSVRAAAAEMQEAVNGGAKGANDGAVGFGFLRTIRTQALGEILMEFSVTESSEVGENGERPPAENPLATAGFEVVAFPNDVRGAQFSVRRIFAPPPVSVGANGADQEASAEA